MTIAGTTGVEARCELARDTVEAATSRTDARSIVAATLKQCADRTVADVGDGRA